MDENEFIARRSKTYSIKGPRGRKPKALSAKQTALAAHKEAISSGALVPRREAAERMGISVSTYDRSDAIPKVQIGRALYTANEFVKNWNFPMELEDLLTSNDLAKKLAVAPITIRKWRLQGIGPPWIVMPNGTSIRYKPSDVSKWLEGEKK